MKEEKPCRFIPLFTQPIISGKSSITMRPKSPGDLTYLETDYTVISTTNSLNYILTQSVEFHKPTDSNWDSVKKSGMCFGNRTQRTPNPPFFGGTAIIINCLKSQNPYSFPKYLMLCCMLLIASGEWSCSTWQ